jgi:hypothetical protein
MNIDDSLWKALWQTAVNDIPENVNLWPLIKAKVSLKEVATVHPRLKLSLTVVIVLVALIVVATVAYACYRLMIDPGLQSVENAGLVSNLNQTAEPTVFATVPTQLAPAVGLSKTLNGITVTLNWAYADENRLALQLSVEGLKLPEGVSTGDFICKLYVSNGQGVSIGSIDPADVQTQKDKPGQPIILTYISYQHIDASRHNHLNLSMDLTIGACGPRWDFGEVFIPGQEAQTPTPPPLIGNYHLNVTVPVYKGLTLTPNQTLVADGISIRLDTITLSPSFTSLHICYLPAGIRKLDFAGWNPQVTIQVGDKKIINLDTYFGITVRDIKSCVEMGVPVAIDPQIQSFKVIVQKIFTGPPGPLSPDEQKVVQQKLASQGIEIAFEEGDGNIWKITKRPGEMTEMVAIRKANEAMTNSIEGPWVFTVEVNR